MNFIEAVYALKEGQKIRRKCWEKSIYLESDKDSIYHIASECGQTISYEWITCDMLDYLAKDWEIIEEENG